VTEFYVFLAQVSLKYQEPPTSSCPILSLPVKQQVGFKPETFDPQLNTTPFLQHLYTHNVEWWVAIVDCKLPWSPEGGRDPPGSRGQPWRTENSEGNSCNQHTNIIAWMLALKIWPSGRFRVLMLA